MQQHYNEKVLGNTIW